MCRTWLWPIYVASLRGQLKSPSQLLRFAAKNEGAELMVLYSVLMRLVAVLPKAGATAEQLSSDGRFQVLSGGSEAMLGCRFELAVKRNGTEIAGSRGSTACARAWSSATARPWCAWPTARLA